MKPSVLVTRRLPSAVMKHLAEGCDVDVHGGSDPMTRHELMDRLDEKEALICLLTDLVDREIIEAGGKLKVIANIAVGFDNIDVRHAATRGIIVTNTPDVLTDSVADFTWALILAITRRLVEGDRVVRAGVWKGWAFDYLLGTELKGKLLGIIGLGRIGRAVATRATAFGMQVVYSNKVVPTNKVERAVSQPDIEQISFDRLLATCDVVTLHVPLTRETHHLIDQAALARMRRSAYLVNTSRGPVVDEVALVWALKNGLLAGAALDVYAHEPHIHQDLLTLDNVILAPHIGSATIETRTRMAETAVSNVLAVLRGEPPLNAVNSSQLTVSTLERHLDSELNG